MGNKVDSRDPTVSWGLYKTYLGDNIFIQPIADEKGNVKNPRESTIIFLHDNNQNPQAYLDLFWNSQKSKVTPWDKSPTVLMLQAPQVVEEKEGIKKCIWCPLNEDVTQSSAVGFVNNILQEQIQAVGGRADKIFIGGVGVGGQLAMSVAFNSQFVLGGTFCLDAAVPDTLYQILTSNEGAAVFPMYE